MRRTARLPPREAAIVAIALAAIAAGCGHHGATLDASIGTDAGGRQRLGCAEGGMCTFLDLARTCEIGAVCSTGDGRGYCVCGSDTGVGVCSPCFVNTPPAPNPPVGCTSDHDCAGGSCIYDRGCPGGSGFCSEVGCDPTAATTYCGCDQTSFTAACPGRAYAHVGACP